MKKVRLEIPMYNGEKKLLLKVKGNQTKLEESDCKEQSFTIEENVSIVVNLPEELQSVEVFYVGKLTPIDDVSMRWATQEENPNWKLPGIKKISIILNDGIYEVPIKQEKPDREKWEWEYHNNRKNMWLFLKEWALVVYTFEDRTVATFHWNSKLMNN